MKKMIQLILNEKKLLKAQMIFWMFYSLMSYWGNAVLPATGPQGGKVYSLVQIFTMTCFIILVFYTILLLMGLMANPKYRKWALGLLVMVLVALVFGYREVVFHFLASRGIHLFDQRIPYDEQMYYYRAIQKIYHFGANAGLLLVVYRNIWKSREHAVEQQKNHQLQVRMLSAAINPHFLFNTLHHLYTDVVKGLSTTASHILLLAELYRYNCLHASDGTVLVPLGDELAQVERFIRLQKYRYPMDLQVEVRIKGITEEWEIPPVTIMTALENGVNYGYYRDKDDPMQLNVECFPHRLRISCRNKIMHQRKDRASTGIGTENLKRRLALQFGRKASVEIINDGTYYEIVITIGK